LLLQNYSSANILKKLLSKEELIQLFIGVLKNPEGQEAIVSAIANRAGKIRKILR